MPSAALIAYSVAISQQTLIGALPRLCSLLLVGLLAQACAVRLPQAPVPIVAPPGVTLSPLPNQSGSYKFAVLGDFGDGSPGQFTLGARMATVHDTFPFGVVVTVGDNIYGRERPSDFVERFERPYARLLSRGVQFHASLGNHDTDVQLTYAPFNMGGQAYYTFSPDPRVRFFALDSTRPDASQLEWIRRELAAATEPWKIPYFHHPLYSSARRHGSTDDLRAAWEPLFVELGVSVVFSGHDHVYERISPQQGITYFVTGSGGKLRPGNLEDDSPFLANGFDRDLVFLTAEIDGDTLHFNAISRLGQIVDAGVITRRGEPDDRR